MRAPLAIYEALLHANAPAEAARHAAEMLEWDMATTLATKQDLHELNLSLGGEIRMLGARIDSLERNFDSRLVGLEQRFDEKLGALEQRIDGKLGALEQRIDGKLGALDQKFEARSGSLEHRIVLKLGALMITLITVSTGVLGVLAAYLVRT